MAKKVFSKSWTRSSTETVEIFHVWSIENFSLQNEKEMISSEFSSAQDVNKRKWQIRLYPNGKPEGDKGYLSMYLDLTNPNPEENIEVNSSFLLHDEREKCLKHMPKIIRTYSKMLNGWGYAKLYKRDELLKEILPSDSLHITCNLRYINGILKTFSGTEEVTSLKAQEELVSCNLADNILGSLLTDHTFSDLTLCIVGGEEERTEFRAHKAILAVRSPYFLAMLTHDFKEKAENRVEIRDVKPEVFREILGYIYTGKFDPQNVKENDAKELLVAADRFALDGLKMAVKNLLVSKLTIENASELLVLGHIHSAEILKARATDFVAANLKQVMETEGWETIIREHPQLMGPILGAVSKKID